MTEKTQKILNILMKAVTWIIVAFTVGIMIFTIVSVSTLDQNDRSIFGIRFFIVKTDSMSPSENNAELDIHFSAGDIVLIKNVDDPKAMRPGDVIAFLSMNTASYGETVTHMIREVKTNKDGKVLGYVTYGTNTGTNDEALVEPEYIIGQYTGKLPKVGMFFQFLKTTPGYIICILIPFLLLIGYNGYNCIRLFMRYKKEQMATMQAERDKIDEERREAAQMLQELAALKAQLREQGISLNTQKAETEEAKESEQNTES